MSVPASLFSTHSSYLTYSTGLARDLCRKASRSLAVLVTLDTRALWKISDAVISAKVFTCLKNLTICSITAEPEIHFYRVARAESFSSGVLLCIRRPQVSNQPYSCPLRSHHPLPSCK